MPVSSQYLANYASPPADQRIIPAAFADFSAGMGEALALRQQRMLAEARMAQEQQQFQTQEDRLWSKQAADEAFDYHTLDVEGGQEEARAKAIALAKRREAQQKAAETVGNALSSGRADAVEALRPYLQSLGVQADIVDEEPTLAPQLSAFSDPSADMTFLPGRRLLRMSADGQPLGEVDLEKIDKAHRAQVDPMIGELIKRASATDRPAYEAMGAAVRASPGMMAEDPSTVFEKVTGAAQRAAGEVHSDERSRLMREQSAINAAASRTASTTRSDRNFEFQRLETVRKIKNEHVNRAMQTAGQKRLIESERDANAAIRQLDEAIKKGQTIEGSAEARLSIGKIVRGLYGAQSSNMELKSIWGMSFGSEAETKFNYYAGGGAIDRDQLQALRNVMVRSRDQLRNDRRMVAESARANIVDDTILQGLVGDTEQIRNLGNDGARSVLGASAPAPEPTSNQGYSPPNALGAQADALDDADESGEFDSLLGDWSPDARP